MVHFFTKLADFYYHLKLLAVGVCYVSLKKKLLILNKIDFTKKITLIFLGAFGILFTIPNVKMKTLEETDGIIGKKLTIKDLIKVHMSFFLNIAEKLEQKSLYTKIMT